MFEDSPEAFISRWQKHAAEAQLFPHREGSPLIECRTGGAILQLFERTGPYLARPGKLRVIVHPVTDELVRVGEGGAAPELTSTGISRITAAGRVVAVADRMVVVDAGAPLVVGVLSELPAGLAVGELVRFESLAPVHGFVVAERSAYSGHSHRDRHDDHI